LPSKDFIMKKTAFLGALVLVLAVMAPLALWAQVTFIINQVPAYTPANANIYMAGTMNGWNPASAAHQLTRLPDSSWAITLPTPSSTLQFKFTRGSWATVEGTATGGPRANRSYAVGGADTVRISILSWEDLHGGGGGGGQSTANAQVQVLTDSFYMPQLNRYRRIWAYLPPDYDSLTNKRYPVIYMHDAQNLFDNLTAFAGEWEIDESMNSLFQQGDRGAIVIGINNGGSQRINEYSPWVNAQYGGGQGAAYVDFIVQTLKPYVDQQFRTDSTRLGTAIWGSSMGGLISQYAAMQYQSVFSKVGVFSPSLWFSSQVYSQVSSIGKQFPMKFFILAGAQESASLVAQVTQLKNDLLANGFTASEVELVVKADGQHSEWFWRREFKPAYQWLFSSASAQLEQALPSIQVYPNPATDRVYVAWGDEKIAFYQLLDVQGRVVLNGEVQAGDSISIATVSPGMYQLRLSSGSRLYHSKLVVR
jgi:predicted alpha/beta superfamily hydrolase